MKNTTLFSFEGKAYTSIKHSKVIVVQIVLVIFWLLCAGAFLISAYKGSDVAVIALILLILTTSILVGSSAIDPYKECTIPCTVHVTGSGIDVVYEDSSIICNQYSSHLKDSYNVSTENADIIIDGPFTKDFYVKDSITGEKVFSYSVSSNRIRLSVPIEIAVKFMLPVT